MNKKISETLRELYQSNGSKMVVTELRGNTHEMLLSDDGLEPYLYSNTALYGGKEKKLKLEWFDGIVDFIAKNGGKVKKGNCYCKIGTGKCQQNTISYYIATECYGKSEGNSASSPISIIAAILVNVGICKHEKGGYLSLAI